MLWILPLIGLVLFEIIADIFSKEWSLKGSAIFWIAAFASYALANVFWLSAIKNGSGLARGAILFAVSASIVASIIGIYFYHESLNKIQMSGIVLGVISLVLIFWDGA